MHTAELDPGADAADAIIAAAKFIAAREAADGAAALFCFTRSGRTAELLSLQRPRTPIVAFTLNPIIARRLAVRSGVIPMVLSSAGGRGEPLLDRMMAAWKAQKNHAEFARVILVTTSRRPQGINRIEVHTVT
jgi:pyruvate kinase